MDDIRLNAYRVMWLFVFFDLPTNTRTDRKYASKFRKSLVQDGFTMMQFSVYTRNCASKESMDVHTKRVHSMIPPKGLVSILSITDKQYGDIQKYWAEIEQAKPMASQQLELF